MYWFNPDSYHLDAQNGRRRKFCGNFCPERHVIHGFAGHLTSPHHATVASVRSIFPAEHVFITRP